MKNVVSVALLAALLAAFVPTSVHSAEFESEFAIAKIKGTCEAKVPGGSFRPAGTDRTYPFGTELKTGLDSSAVVRFSKNNGCLVLAETSIVIGEDAADRTLKILQIMEGGSVEVMLEPTFHEHNSLKVETPSAVCGAVGCHFRVTYSVVGDLLTTTVECLEGEITVEGLYFFLMGMDTGEENTVGQSPDGDFVSVKIVEGELQIKVTEPDGSQKYITLVTGDEVEILKQESLEEPDVVVVVYNIKYADVEKQAEVFQVEIEEIVVEQEPQTLGDWENMTIQTPLPVEESPTPVGKRGTTE